jgi:hypothetical protein
MSDSDSMCVVTGPAGSGKSATLAQLTRALRLQQPNAMVLCHFVGATRGSSTLRDLLGRLCQELKQRLNLSFPVPPGSAERMSFFLSLLLGVPTRVRVVLVLDGLDRLEPEQDAHSLNWLPERLRSHVKIVASCRDDRAAPHPVLSAFLGRKCQLLPLSPLTDDEKRQVIASLPRMPVRALLPEQAARLLAHPGSGNPLFLTVALEELRAGSAGIGVDDWLARLPTEGPLLVQLFELVVSRLEQEFDHELVPTTLALLACARRGLSEAELVELTSDCQLHAGLFPLLRWLRPYVWNRAGQLTFLQPQLKQAVERLFLKRVEGLRGGPLSEEEKAVRTRLAHYFATIDDRRVEEVPWQLAEMRAWESLAGLLADLPFLAALWHFSEADVKAYWRNIRANSTERMADAYRPVLEDPAGHEEHVAMLATLLQSANQLEEALVLRQYQAECQRRAGDLAKLAQALGSQATLHLARNDLTRAMDVLKEQEKLCRDINDSAWLKNCLANQAAVLRKSGNYHAALAVHKEEEQLSRQVNSAHGVALSLINQAHVLADKLKQPASGLPLAEEAYRLATRHGFNNLAGQIKTRLQRMRHLAQHPDQPPPDSKGEPSSLPTLPESGVS